MEIAKDLSNSEHPPSGDKENISPVHQDESLGSFQAVSLNDDRANLSDDADHGVDFRRTKLKVNAEELYVADGDDLDFSINDGEREAEVKVEDRLPAVGFSRDRPFGASVVSTTSRASRASTKSKVSLSPHIRTSDVQAKNLFCYRSSAIEKAVEDCKSSVIIKTIDGDIKGYWLLTEIDHWDLEKERLVILLTQSLLVVKYDFIALKPSTCKRIQLNVISYVEVGDLLYPRYSVMPSRDHGGVRIHWSGSAATPSRMWNPLCEDVGFLTLTHHLLAYNEKERETITFDVADLVDSVVEAVRDVRQAERRTETLQIENRPIVIESYANAVSLVFNQSHIGFHMERGGVSF